ncbi:hypothetical protein H0H81_011284 [Sphagnurus paluster]|uniref:Copper radical oxidase n=1 Tax=Sphagnurus paluster TaxID=117069 RepID=A0A9P7GPN5_9AGAR|nr:hypothetical protein H0H81_011284 [Sphagnurus paluster]
MDSAWNGHTIPGSTAPAPFTPFYVPPGAKAYDSSSPLILYTGQWSTIFSSAYFKHTIQSTSKANAAISFKFVGTGIEWFGNCDRRHGIATVVLDGKKKNVDAYCDHDSPLKQQRIFWDFNLHYGEHTIKIINTAKRPGSKRPTKCDIDAFVVTRGTNPKSQSPLSSKPSASFLQTQNLASSVAPKWTLTQKGTTGVHAMQLAIISSTHALIVDKVEHNPLTIHGHPAWAALYNLKTHAVKPLDMQSNSFCAGGTFLSNGTLINVGGNPVVDGHTSSADFGDLDGLQAVRIFEPCDSESLERCKMYEHHSRIRMASPRWYNTVLRINDGSAMIIGGSKKGGWINNATVNNPSIEYFPPKGIHGSKGLPIHLPFLVDTLSSNLFPIAFSLPDGNVFIAANRDAMIYDWKNNRERRLPRIPNSIRVTYPMAGTALLLPLSPENNYEPEILICGGSNIPDDKASYDISSQDPATSQCSRMVLTEAGIVTGWKVESMPQARTMPDAVLLPTGEVFIVNGASTGISGYGNVRDQVGSSNADHPVLTPILYDPRAITGQRFSSAGLPSSPIPRLYHSVATLTPAGDIMVAGSNPNLDRSEIQYGTEYRVEWFSPPYMGMNRPEVIGKLSKLNFKEEVKVQVKVPAGNKGQFKGRESPLYQFLPSLSFIHLLVALMDLGYVTHAVHANTRLVYLTCSMVGDILTITGPPNGDIYPPGPGWIYFLVDAVPSVGLKVMIGSGASPPVDRAALESLLKNSDIDQYEKLKGGNEENLSE